MRPSDETAFGAVGAGGSDRSCPSSRVGVAPICIDPSFLLDVDPRSAPVVSSRGMFGLCGRVSGTVGTYLQVLSRWIGASLAAGGCIFDDGQQIFSAEYRGAGGGVGASVGASAGLAKTNATSRTELEGTAACIGGSAAVLSVLGPVGVGSEGELCVGYAGVWPHRDGPPWDELRDAGQVDVLSGTWTLMLGASGGGGTPEAHWTTGSSTIRTLKSHRRLPPGATWIDVVREVLPCPFMRWVP